MTTSSSRWGIHAGKTGGPKGEAHVIELAWANQWKPATDITALTGANAARVGSELTCFGVNGSDSRLYYFDGNNEVNELAWNGGWKRNPL